MRVKSRQLYSTWICQQDFPEVIQLTDDRSRPDGRLGSKAVVSDTDTDDDSFEDEIEESRMTMKTNRRPRMPFPSG